MYARIPKDHPLRLMFSGLVDQIFATELGLCNPRITEYLSELLTEFVHVDRIYRLHRVDGRTIHEVSQMEADAVLGAEADAASRTRIINRYIGDFTLFWTGVYPEHLRLRRHGGDRLREYLLRGKRSYTIAGELTPPNEHPPGALFRELSAEFESCVHGLNIVRSNFDQTGLGPN